MLKGLKTQSLKSNFYKMVAIYKILYIYLEGDLAQFEVSMLIPLVPVKSLRHLIAVGARGYATCIPENVENMNFEIRYLDCISSIFNFQ